MSETRVRKAIAINDDDGHIVDLGMLAAVAKAQARRILGHTNFRILPSVQYDIQFHCYTVLVECDARQEASPGFEAAMERARTAKPA
jgi:uncharacterized protein YjaG (DUF416 family)